MRALIATVVVLILLLIGADVAARLIAESKVEQAIETKLDGSGNVDVSVHDVSFLIDAISGSYSHLTITSSGVTAGTVKDVSGQVDLYDVKLPLSDALGGNVDQLTAGHATARIVVPEKSLPALFPMVPGARITSGPNGTLQFTTSIDVADQQIPVVVNAAVTISQDQMKITAQPVQAAGITIPAAVSTQLEQDLTTTIPLDALPFPLDSATVTTQLDDVIVTASASNLTAQQMGLTG